MGLKKWSLNADGLLIRREGGETCAVPLSLHGCHLGRSRQAVIEYKWSVLLHSFYRYHQYLTVTMPIVNIYEKKGLVRRISSVPPPDQVIH